MLMKDKMKTKYMLTLCNAFLKIDLTCANRCKNRFKIKLTLKIHMQFSKKDVA